MPCIQDITVMGAYDVQGVVIEDCSVGREEEDYLLEITGIESQTGEISASEMRDMVDALGGVEDMLDLCI